MNWHPHGILVPLSHLFCCSWVSWASYRFWMLIMYQMHTFQIFPSTLSVSFSLCSVFSLLCRSCFSWCNPICLFLVLLLVLLWSHNINFSNSCTLCLATTDKIYSLNYFGTDLFKWNFSSCVHFDVKIGFHFFFMN